jgi:hypothetical protein
MTGGSKNRTGNLTKPTFVALRYVVVIFRNIHVVVNLRSRIILPGGTRECRLLCSPKLSDFPAAIIIYASQFSGGDKPHPYLFGGISFVVAGFIPASKGADCRIIHSIKDLII